MNKKECANCHKSFPATAEYFHRNKINNDGLHSYCKACRNEMVKPSRKIYYDKTKNKYSKINKEYYQENKDHIIKKSKKWYADNTDKKREYDQRNKAKIKKRQKAWRETNIIKIRKLWRKATKKRNQLLTKTIVNFTKKDWTVCLKYFNNCCAYCGKKKSKLEKDHIVPLTKGGNFTKDNIIPACKSCNSSKSNNDFLGWYSQQSFFRNKRFYKISAYLEQITS